MRRFVFAPRWVLGHVLIVIAVVSCMLLARWQWHVSQHTHSLQNLAYALQWPLFGVFFGVMWYRMLRLESERLDDEELAAEDGAPGADAPAEPVAAGQADPEAGRRTRNAKPPLDTPLLVPARDSGTATGTRDAAPPEEDGDEEDAQLAAYNRMLAELAARDQAR
jgi:hypothetical protein